MTVMVLAPRVRGVFTGSPGRLRLVGVGAALAALACGLLAGWTFQFRADALDDARAGAAQVVRLQTVETALARADADATRAFLTGGVEPVALRTDYTTAVDLASRTLTAAASRTDDTDALAEVTADLTTYTGLVEQARAANRQGLPVGAAYLRQGSTLLRGTMLPTLDTALAAEVQNVSDAYARADLVTALVLAALVLCVAALVWSQYWLAQRVRRVFNVPAATSTALVVLVLAVGALDVGLVQQRLAQVRAGSYAATLALSGANIAVYDAASNEALALINRGSGATYHAAAADDLDEAAADLAEAAAAGAGTTAGWDDALDAWRTVHERIRTLDEDGSWDDAVALATGDADDASPALLAHLESTLSDALATRSAEAQAGLGAVRPWLVAGTWLSVLAGLVAAVGTWTGFAQRLQEYR